MGFSGRSWTISMESPRVRKALTTRFSVKGAEGKETIANI